MPFSQPLANAACNFFERILKHTMDEWYGKPFNLMPWQEEALEAIFGNVDERGNRTIEMAYLEVPKKAGKSEWAAGIALNVLMLTKEPGCQVYGVAAATRQALTVFRAACKMVEQSPILSSSLRILRGTNRIVKRSDPDSFYAAVAADGDLGDGVNPACVIADEVHRYKTRKHLENWDVLSNGGLTRKQTLTIAITTAGVQNDSPLAWRLHEKTRKINEGIVIDERFYGRIYGADREDDPADPKTWIKANPSLKENGGFFDIEKVRAKYHSHLAEGDLRSFKRYFLNIWDQQEDRAVDMRLWDQCQGGWTAKPLLPKRPEDRVRVPPHEVLKRFAEKKCWVGIDLSMTTDLTAVSVVFPRDAGGYDILPFFWTPEKNLAQREFRDGVPYRQWAEQGWLEVVSGAVIEPSEVRARLEWAAQMFNVQQFVFDPYNSREMSTRMIEDGFPCVEVRQGFYLNEESKKFLSMIAQNTLGHGNHPIMRHHASCLQAHWKEDRLMFVKPDREKNSTRIDGVSATLDALSQALVMEDNTIMYVAGSLGSVA